MRGTSSPVIALDHPPRHTCARGGQSRHYPATASALSTDEDAITTKLRFGLLPKQQ